jgi:hypothetical protein
MVKSNAVLSDHYNHRLARPAGSKLDFIPLLFLLELFIKLTQDLLLFSELNHLQVFGHLLLLNKDLQFVVGLLSLGVNLSLRLNVDLELERFH